MKGKVYLVGAGPGDPELLTMKAARILRSADVVLHDALVSEEILRLVRPHARLVDVGKRAGQKRWGQDAINRLLIEAAEWAETVVRLKGGDPLLFGRAAEEIAALRRAGIDFEIVPGITAALGAAAYAQIPLTDRQSSAAVIFLTAQQATIRAGFDTSQFASKDVTLSIYMPGGNYREIAESLMNAGLLQQTPCLIVSNASRPNQQLLWTDVGHLRNIEPPEAPALLIIGEVARRWSGETAFPLLATLRGELEVVL